MQVKIVPLQKSRPEENERSMFTKQVKIVIEQQDSQNSEVIDLELSQNALDFASRGAPDQ